MAAIFFEEEKNKGLDLIKLTSDDCLLSDKFEHYQNLKDDEDLFLEPFLIAHYHQPERKISQSLDQLLLGFMDENNMPETIKVRSDVKGVIYLSKVGYLITAIPNTTFTLHLSTSLSEKKCRLVLGEEDIPFDFEALRYVPDTDIEIFRHSHEYIIHKLENDPLITNVHLETESTEWVDKYSETIIKAFAIIQKVDPVQFAELKELTKKIVFFKADRFVNFTSMDFQGVIFISTYESSKELPFMDTLIHECGHLALNLVLVNSEEYFTIDPDELKFRSPFRDTLRGLYQSIHATYVLAKLIRFFNNCYKAEVFSGIEKYELIGLLLLDIKLLEEGLEYIGNRSVYTDKGWTLYKEIQNVYLTVCEERKDIINQYKLPDTVRRNAAVTPKDFEIDTFLKANNLTREDLGLAA